jgi:hypothetical protein
MGELQICYQKIAKLRLRRNVDINKKFCSLCQKEYKESENFNWSCCTHRSEWGGQMWWCCGKTKQTAQGCKFQKHVCKDKEDEDEQEGDQNQKLHKCQICKKQGHRENECG